MILKYTPYGLVLLISAIITGIVAWYVWKRRAAPGGIYFAWMMIATTEWAFFNALEVAASGTWIDYACNSLLYVGVVAVPTLWLIFTVEFSRRSGWLTFKRKVLLFVMPAIFLGLVATDHWHGLVWSSIVPVSDAFGLRTIYEHGIVDWAIMAYSYSLMVIGTIVLLATAMRALRPYRSQTWTLLLGMAIPWLGNVIYFADIGPFHGVDFTPLTLAITGIIFTWGIFRQGLFDIMPVARDRLITSMADGVLVLDDKNRVVEINPVARRLFGTTGRMVGLPAKAVIAIWPYLAIHCEDRQKKSVEIRLEDGKGPGWLETHITPLQDRGGRPNGMLLVLRDITERKHRETLLQQAYDELITSNETLQTEIMKRKKVEEQILASLEEKNVLLKEIHHRVKNNLQVISSLLNLQSGNMSPESAGAFKESQNRIKSMALVHEKLYRSQDLSHLDFAEYVSSLTAFLARSYPANPGVKISLNLQPISLDIDTAIPCSLIINELVSNSLKYAFPDGRTGIIHIGLALENGVYRLTIGDNGIGLPQGTDYGNTGSLGLQLVDTLVDQLEGTIELEPGRGATYMITFKENTNNQGSKSG